MLQLRLIRLTAELNTESGVIPQLANIAITLRTSSSMVRTSAGSSELKYVMHD